MYVRTCISTYMQTRGMMQVLHVLSSGVVEHTTHSGVDKCAHFEQMTLCNSNRRGPSKYHTSFTEHHAQV